MKNNNNISNYLNQSSSFAIHIIGERHSGTNWIEDEMQKCFGHAIRVVPTLFRFKHWWQSPSVASTTTATTTLPTTLPLHNNNSNDTRTSSSIQYGIVIALFRNPYDWMEAMRTEPHHAIEHWDIVPNKPLKWKEFMTKPWSLDRLKFQDWMTADLSILKQVLHPEQEEEDTLYNSTTPYKKQGQRRRIMKKFSSLSIPISTYLHPLLFNHSCYEEFYWFDIIPCSRQDRDITKMIVPFAEALYELQRDGSGRPFDNIIQLRTEKLHHFYQEVSQFQSIQHFFPHRYEDLVTQGTQILIDQIQQALPGIQATCQPSPPKKYLHKLLPKGMFDYLNQHLNWTVENVVGYRQWSEKDLWEEKQEYNQWNIENYIRTMDAKAKKMKARMNESLDNTMRDKSQYGIHIIGERHSGTTFLQRHLQSCFGQDLRIYSNLTRHKYWFQLDNSTMDYGLVVATFRNVYDWIKAMNEKPYHAPLHYDFEKQKPFPFQSFLTKEWGLDRQRFKKLVKDDLKIMEFYENADANQTKGKAIHMETCYEHFHFYDLIPCSYQDRVRTQSLVSMSGDDEEEDGDSGAVYEMKMDHNKKRLEPYRSIMELRRDKMIHFYIEVSKFASVSHFIPVKFEDMVINGTALLIKEIEKKMGVTSKCVPEKLSVKTKIDKRQRIFTNMVNEGVDWSAEALMGYERIELTQKHE